MALHPCLTLLPKKYQNQLKGLDFEQQRKFIQDNIDSTDHSLRKAINTAQAQSKIWTFFGQQSREELKDSLLDFFGAKGRIKSGMGSLYGRVKAIEYKMHTMFREAMEHHRPGVLGRRRSAKNERNIIRELFGENTGDDLARAFSQQWQKVANYAMKRFNAAGGNITRLMDFNMPMYHDAARIGRVKYEEWFKDVRDLIDKERLAKLINGSTTISDEQLDKVMRKIYNKLSTDGVVKFDDIPISNMARKQMGDYHQEHRVLHFTSGENWLKYQDKYGGGTPFGAMTSYMEGMSREIGAMELLGANHDQTLRALKEFADGAIEDSGSTSRKMQAIYDNVMGATYGRSQLGDIAQNLRFISVITKLGMALPASLGDAAFVGSNLMRLYGKASAIRAVGQMFGRTATLQTHKLRTIAARMGLGADYAQVAARSAARISETYGHGILARASDATIRASGLNVWTNVGKQVFGVESLMNLSAQAGKEFGGLPKNIRAMLDTYGVGKKEWDILRRFPQAEVEGVRFLDFQNAAFGEQTEAVSKLIGGIVEETHIAVPEPNPRIRAMMNRGTKSGTIPGELLRTFGLFKTFPVTAAVTQLARASTMSGMDRVSYLGSLIAGSTILGTMGIQAKEVLKGNDPYKLNDPVLYGKGFIQGGVAGLVGDILFTDPNLFGGLSGAIAGPVVGDLNRVGLQFMMGTMKDIMTLEDNILQNAVREGVAVAKSMTPGRMWYTRLAIDRSIDLFMNQLNDPAWSKKQRSLQRRMQREEDRGQWFRPGQALPSRPPQVGFK